MMHDFTFHNPTKIIFGKETEHRIGDILYEEGVKNVLFLYGTGSIKNNTLYDDVIASLNKHGIAYSEYSGVSSNPTLAHTIEGIAKAKADDVDAILCVGGGSVLDEGKAIAVGALDDGDVWDYFTGKPVTAALPVYTILTLAASGSEMNGNSVITNTLTNQKFSFSSALTYPKVSILNPELTFSVNPAYTAYGSVDAVAHVIEGYFTQESGSGIQDRLCESIISSVIEATAVVMQEPEDYDARAQIMWSATLALNGLPVTGLKNYSFPNHMIEHSLSALYNIAHGAGLSIVIPAWMQWYKEKNPERFTRFAKEVFGKSSADEGIEALKAWFRSIGAPVSLAEADIPASDIDAIAENAAQTAKVWGMSELYSSKDIEEILMLAR